MYCLRKKKSIVIADHGCTFNHKSNFIYKTKTLCEGYSIRKLNWQQILDDSPQIAEQLKRKIITSYFYGTKLKVMSEKRKEIKRLRHRSDIQQILVVTDKDKERGDMEFLTEKLTTAKLRGGNQSMAQLLQDEEEVTKSLVAYEQGVVDVLKYVDDYLATHEKLATLIDS